MAHPKSKRMALRSAYCYKALSLEEAAALVGISIGTARRWKVDAQKAEDDDWDKVKAASSLAGEGMEAVARQMLNDYVLQQRTLMERIGKDEDMQPAEKVEALSCRLFCKNHRRQQAHPARNRRACYRAWRHPQAGRLYEPAVPAARPGVA